MLKTSMSDYEKIERGDYPFYFINRQTIPKTNCMQRIKNILMQEALKSYPLMNLKIFETVHNLMNCTKFD